MLLSLALTSASCAFRPARAVREIPPGEWHATMGGPARAAFVDETVPGAPQEAWRERYDGGVSSAPLVHGDLLIMANARSLTVASALDGGRYWSRRFDGAVVGSPLRSDTMLFVATASRRGRVHALSIERGRARWQARLNSPVTSEPILFETTIFVATVRRELHALDSGTGTVRWRIRLPGQAITAPLVHERSLLLATQRDTLLRMRTQDGAIEAAAALPGSASAPLALSDTTLIVALHPDRIAGFDARTLAPRWSVRVHAPVLAAPVVDADGTAFVLTRAGDVWQIAPDGAAARLAQLGGTARESLTLTRDALLVGRLDGTLFVLARDGTERWHEQFRSSVRSPVAVRDGELFVALLNGTVVNLR
ncbi:MAG TPA: PQQ-binding-like beta-propeller repeat protein [Longimicrobiales bacterium]|nr:PQQ-binding-like beta-propeller repeat protein [Longimicrobiales bacterium]